MVRQKDLENSECGENLSKNGRTSYTSEEDTDFIKERYVRVAAIITATIEGTKNNYVLKTNKKPITFATSNTINDVPR